MSDVAEMTGGVSFALTEDQQMLQKMARDFAQKEIMPVAEEHDHHAKFPMDIFKKAWELGITNMNVP